MLFGCEAWSLTLREERGLGYLKTLHKKGLNAGNSCYYSVKTNLSSRFLSKNLKIIKINKTIILPVVLFGCEAWSLISREERSLEYLKTGSAQ